MKFSKSLISTLKNFATINAGIYLREGDFIMTKAANGTIYAETLLTEEDRVAFDVAIYDLNSFLSILSLSGEDSDVTIQGNVLVIKNGKRSQIAWPIADHSSIKYPLKRMNLPEPMVQFDITADTYNQIMKISRGVGSDTLVISSTGDNVVIKAFNKAADLKLDNPLAEFTVMDEYKGGEFNFVINMKNMKVQPDNYTVKLWSGGGRFATKFESETTSYIIAVESESTENF